MKRLFSLIFLLLHTLANARVFVPVEEINATKASLQAAATATVVGTLNHQGNIFKAVEDLGKPQGLKSLALAGLTGGLMEGASLHLKLPKQPQTFAGHFQKAAV
ncbi:MAG: DUF637 domain-containing protein, partial [Alphaproteobacteria bacterium]